MKNRLCCNSCGTKSTLEISVNCSPTLSLDLQLVLEYLLLKEASFLQNNTMTKM